MPVNNRDKAVIRKIARFMQEALDDVENKVKIEEKCESLNVPRSSLQNGRVPKRLD